MTPTAPTPRIGTGTTSFAVADSEGNMIAVTQTLSTWGGTFYVSKGLGFLYNNHLRSSRTTAGAYGSLRAVDAIEHDERPDARVRTDPGRRGDSEAGRRLCRQRVDSGERLQRHHRRHRRQAWRAAGDRSAAVPAGTRSGRSARERRAHRDRGSLPARAASGSDRPRPPFQRRLAEGRGPLRLRGGDRRGRGGQEGGRRRRAAPLARGGRVRSSARA